MGRGLDADAPGRRDRVVRVMRYSDEEERAMLVLMVAVAGAFVIGVIVNLVGW